MGYWWSCCAPRLSQGRESALRAGRSDSRVRGEPTSTEDLRVGDDQSLASHFTSIGSMMSPRILICPFIKPMSDAERCR